MRTGQDGKDDYIRPDKARQRGKPTSKTTGKAKGKKAKGKGSWVRVKLLRWDGTALDPNHVVRR